MSARPGVAAQCSCPEIMREGRKWIRHFTPLAHRVSHTVPAVQVRGDARDALVSQEGPAAPPNVLFKQSADQRIKRRTQSVRSPYSDRARGKICSSNSTNRGKFFLKYELMRLILLKKEIAQPELSCSDRCARTRSDTALSQEV